MRIRGAWILGLLVAAVLVGLGAYAYHVANRVLVVRIATGPSGSFGNQFAVSVVHLVSLEHPQVKVRITSLASDSDALKASPQAKRTSPSRAQTRQALSARPLRC